MRKDIQSAEEWDEIYRKGYISENHFFMGLIRCVKFQDPAKVVSVLTANELEAFKCMVAKYIDVEDYSEWVGVGDPPVWEKTEIDKLVKLLNIQRCAPSPYWTGQVISPPIWYKISDIGPPTAGTIPVPTEQKK